MHIPSQNPLSGTDRVNHLVHSINQGLTINGYPLPLVWLELFLQNFPQAMTVFNAMSKYQQREGIEVLKQLRNENWPQIVLQFIHVNDLDYTALCEAFSEEESNAISFNINYWDTPTVILFLRRTSGFLCHRISYHIWHGSYYRLFSHHLFFLFSQIEGTNAFSQLQSYISMDTAHKALPAIKEDVDILLKWILSASKSSPVKATIKSLELIYCELNDNQRRRLILRSVRFYPETFLYVLTVLSEDEAKLICRQNLQTMNQFFLDKEDSRSLIPQSRGNALRTILSKGRFPLKGGRYHHTYEDIFRVLKNIPVYEQEDYDYIASIPPFIFCFFEHWNRFRKDIKLVINELNEQQLRALSFGINKENARRLLPELEKAMTPQHFGQFLSFFQVDTIEVYLSLEYIKICKTLEMAAEYAQRQNEDEIYKSNLQLIQLRQSPVTAGILKLCEQRVPGAFSYVHQEIDRCLMAFHEFMESRKPAASESSKSLSYLFIEGDRDIGLMDDDDVVMLRVKNTADKFLLEEYRAQPKLADSWNILHKRRIYALKELEIHFLIESREECFKLHELAVKLL